MAEPFRKSVEKSVEDVLNEFLSGKYPSIDFDFGHLWVRAMTALGSAVSGGLAFAGIRFLFTVLLRKTEQPEFCRLMEVAKDNEAALARELALNLPVLRIDILLFQNFYNLGDSLGANRRTSSS
jgi:hypothetical protein